MRKPTARQLEMLAFIRQFLAARSYPPTAKEIAERFGFSSLNSVTETIARLRAHGLIKPAPFKGAARSFVPTP